MRLRQLTASAFILLAATSATGAPTTQSSAPPSEEVLQLVVRLGAASAADRDQAQKQLEKIGAPALPLLEKAAASGDPELASRAARAIHHIQHPSIPGGPLGDEPFVTVQTTFNQSGRTISARTSDRTFLVHETPDGVEVTVTANEDGQPVTETYKAHSPEQLRQLEPDAYSVYQRVALDTTRNLHIQIQGGGVMVLGGNAAVAMLDPIEKLRDQLDLQMQRQHVPPARRARVLAGLAAIKRLRAGDLNETDTARDRRLKEYFQQSDALHKQLDELKLDAGDVLPPPAKARLGIELRSVQSKGTDRLMVMVVVGGSRAQKIGLKPGDILQKIDGREIHELTELREMLATTRDPLRVEILRGNKPNVLKEAPEPAPVDKQ